MKRHIALAAISILAGCSDGTASKNATPNADTTANNAVAGNVVTIASNNSVEICGVQCAGGDPLCNTQTRTCVECAADSHCGAAEPICDLAEGECRECLTDADCSGERSICDPIELECVPPCATDADCAEQNGDATFCDAATSRCLECATDAECGDGDPLCDGGVCVECVADADCGPGETCHASRRECIECLSDADCDGGICRDFECSECATDADCPASAPLCNPAEGKCEVCVSTDDCPTERPICDGGDECVECTEDEHCGAGFKCSSKTCEAE